MKFWVTQDCIDQGDLQHVDKSGVPIRYAFRLARQASAGPYEISEDLLKQLTAHALFPEFFQYADDTAKAWVEAHNDELCDIVDNRKLPYRKLTAAEEQNDLDIQRGRKEGEFTLPHGTVDASLPKLVRKGRTLTERTTGGTVPLVEGENINLQRKTAKAPEPTKPSGRKPMSDANRKAAGERLAKARAAKAAQKVTA
jgi:hypothetical protein